MRQRKTGAKCGKKYFDEYYLKRVKRLENAGKAALKQFPCIKGFRINSRAILRCHADFDLLSDRTSCVLTGINWDNVDSIGDEVKVEVETSTEESTEVED